MGKTWNQIWTPLKWQRAEEMRDDGCTFEQIGTALGLSASQVQTKFTNECYAHKASAAKEKLKERLDQRDALFGTCRTLTESLCGDPLPGRSALDKKRAGPSP